MSITTEGWYLLAGLSGEDISSTIYSNYDVNGVELNSAYVALGRDLSSVFNDYPVTSYSSVDLSSITLFPTNFNENQNANDISFIGTDVSDISNMSIFKMNNFSILDLSSQAKFPFNMGVWCLFKSIVEANNEGGLPSTPTITINTNGSFNLEGVGLSGKVISQGRIQWTQIQFTDPNNQPTSSDFVGKVNDNGFTVVKLLSVISQRQLNFDSEAASNAERTISDSNIPLFTLSSYTINNNIPLLDSQCFIEFTDGSKYEVSNGTLIVNIAS